MDRERLTVYPRIMLAMFVMGAIVYALLVRDNVDITGKPLGTDFLTFYAASQLLLSGHGMDAYDLSVIGPLENAIVPTTEPFYFPWFYPPPYLLLVAPLSVLPYAVSYLLWALAGAALMLGVLLTVVKREGLWLALAFPGVWICFAHGQNGVITAALAGAALLQLKKRPVLAGVLIGLLVIKPHLAVLFPVALIAARAWKAFAAAAVSAVVTLVSSALVLGLATIRAWLGSMGDAAGFIESGYLPWSKMPGVFAALRLLGAGVTAAYAVQAVVALAAIVTVWRIWRSTSSMELRGAALMSAIFLVNPYGFDYDTVWLAFPIAWVALYGRRHGWRRGEREVLVAAYVLPAMISPLGALHVGVAPLVVGAFLLMVARRALPARQEAPAVVAAVS